MHISTIRRASIGIIGAMIGVASATTPASAVPTDTPPAVVESPTPTTSAAGAAGCGVDFSNARLWNGRVEFGGKVTCYGVGRIASTIDLVKWSPENQAWVVVARADGANTGVSHTLNSSIACRGTITRTYRIHMYGSFTSYTANVPGGSFSSWNNPNNVACNAW